MEIKPKTKKIIFISSGSILAIAVLVWYFFPVLMVNWFWYQSGILLPYLKVNPIPIIALKAPPKEWKKIDIGDLTMKLPMSKYKKIRNMEALISFISDSGSLVVSDIAPQKEILQMIKENKLGYPVVPYQDYLAIFSSTPANVSLFNSRNKNTTALYNQILKAISIPIGGISKLLTVNTGTLKALCILSEKRDNCYQAAASVYSQNEKAFLSILLTRYKDQTTLEADLLAILGGIKMPDHMNDLEQVSKDINRLITQYNKK